MFWFSFFFCFAVRLEAHFLQIWAIGGGRKLANSLLFRFMLGWLTGRASFGRSRAGQAGGSGEDASFIFSFDFDTTYRDQTGKFLCISMCRSNCRHI
jgi:hypothetical protein